MPSCFVCGRSLTAKSKSENISFHRFPSKEYILQKWHGFFQSHDLAVDKIKKNSLICSLHFVPESFIVQNKLRLLQKHAIPTIKISRVKGAKINYPELKEKIPLTEHSSSTSKLHMKKLLVKESYRYDPHPRVTRTINPDLTASSSETLSLRTPSVKEVPNISELPEGFVPLANLDQTMASKSSGTETLSPCTPKVPNISEVPERFAPLANLDQTMATSSSGSETLNLPTPTVIKKFKSSFLAAIYDMSPNDTPSRSYLKYGVRTLSDEIQIKNKKIKALQQIVRRKNKKIASMSEIICKLKKNNLLTEEDPNILLESFGNNEKMEEPVDIDNINDDNVANVCNDNMLNNHLNGDFMDTSYTKQNVNTIQHDHNYFITAEGLMNEKYADVKRTIIKDASTDQLDKDVSFPNFDEPEKTSITITNAPKSVLKNSTNILTVGLQKKERIIPSSGF